MNNKKLKEVKRDIKATVIKIWTHMGEQTEIDRLVNLTETEYKFCLDKGLVEPVQGLLPAE